MWCAHFDLFYTITVASIQLVVWICVCIVQWEKSRSARTKHTLIHLTPSGQKNLCMKRKKKLYEKKHTHLYTTIETDKKQILQNRKNQHKKKTNKQKTLNTINENETIYGKMKRKKKRFFEFTFSEKLSCSNGLFYLVQMWHAQHTVTQWWMSQSVCVAVANKIFDYSIHREIRSRTSNYII